MSDRECPLGEDCDLTVAWMAGAETQREHMHGRIEELALQLKMSRYEADELRKRADYAENRYHELMVAINELRPLVFGANRHEERYPRAVAILKGEA